MDHKAVAAANALTIEHYLQRGVEEHEALRRFLSSNAASTKPPDPLQPLPVAAVVEVVARAEAQIARKCGAEETQRWKDIARGSAVGHALLLRYAEQLRLRRRKKKGSRRAPGCGAPGDRRRARHNR